MQVVVNCFIVENTQNEHLLMGHDNVMLDRHIDEMHTMHANVTFTF